MNLSKRQRMELLQRHCGVIQDDDAIDPRHYFYNKRKPDSKHRKAFQLCRQVLDTLTFTLAESEPIFAGLIVVDVIPAPDARRMLVMLAPSSDRVIESASEIEQIMLALQSHTPRLRAEIARTIHRRKTPNLIFEITKIPSGRKGD